MQVLANGLIDGLVIGLLGLSFAAVYLPTRVFHIALAGVYVVSPFVTWWSLGQGLPWILAIGSGVLAGVVISMGCELFNHRRLARLGATPEVHLIASLGIGILLVQMITILWGSDTKVLRVGTDPRVLISGLVITRAQIIQAAAAFAAIGLFFVWLQSSNVGLRFRALADEPTELSLRGYDIERLRLVAFGLSGLLVSVASLATGYELGITPRIGFQAMLLAVVAAIIGGRSSFLGPVVAGLILGVVRAEVAWYLSARWQEAVTFALLALFLFFLPSGILANQERIEAES